MALVTNSILSVGSARVSTTGSFGHASPGTTLDVRGAEGAEAGGATPSGVAWIGNTAGAHLSVGALNTGSTHVWLQARASRSTATYARMILQPSGGTVVVGTLTAPAGASDGEIAIAQGKWYRSTTAALLRSDSSGRLELALNSKPLSLSGGSYSATVGATTVPAAALPANPVGYIRIMVEGVEMQFPYYNKP